MAESDSALREPLVPSSEGPSTRSHATRRAGPKDPRDRIQEARAKLVGVWELVAAEYRPEESDGPVFLSFKRKGNSEVGDVVEYLGENPRGSLIYSSNGFMSVQVRLHSLAMHGMAPALCKPQPNMQATSAARCKHVLRLVSVPAADGVFPARV